VRFLKEEVGLPPAHVRQEEDGGSRCGLLSGLLRMLSHFGRGGKKKDERSAAERERKKAPLGQKVRKGGGRGIHFFFLQKKLQKSKRLFREGTYSYHFSLIFEEGREKRTLIVFNRRIGEEGL